MLKSLGWLPNLQEGVPPESASSTDHFWIKNKKGERFRCDTRFKTVENWSVDTGKSAGELFFEWLRHAIFHSSVCRTLSGIRFWGREFKYDESVVCMRRGGMIPRKGKSAPKDPNSVPSTSTQLEAQEPPDDEQDEEADEEILHDESFDADWSRNPMCVADPFIVAKVIVFLSLR